MSSLNRVFLIGNLTRDPEIDFTPQGTAIAKFGLAVNRQYKGSDGEMKKEVEFFNIVVWGKSGENCKRFLAKGSPVFIEGRLHNRSFDTSEGQKRTVTEIVADAVQFLSSGQRQQTRRQDEPDAPESDHSEPAYGPGEDVPF